MKIWMLLPYCGYSCEHDDDVLYFQKREDAVNWLHKRAKEIEKQDLVDTMRFNARQEYERENKFRGPTRSDYEKWRGRDDDYNASKELMNIAIKEYQEKQRQYVDSVFEKNKEIIDSFVYDVSLIDLDRYIREITVI